MRRLVWISALAFALAAPAVGFALSGDDDGTLSVKAGVGNVYVNFNGSGVGPGRRGSIRGIGPGARAGGGFAIMNPLGGSEQRGTTPKPERTAQGLHRPNPRLPPARR